MSVDDFVPFTAEDLAAEGVTALPDKEVVSILDLAADVDLAIDGAAPIDLAVALNANIVAPIDAAVSANLLSDGPSRRRWPTRAAVVNQTSTPMRPRPASRTAPSTSPTRHGRHRLGRHRRAPLSATTADSSAARRHPVRPKTARRPTRRCHRRAGRPSTAPSSWTPPARSSARWTARPARWSTLTAPCRHAQRDHRLVVDATGPSSAGDEPGGRCSVAGPTGDVVGVLDGATGNVLDSTGNVVGILDPVTGQVVGTSATARHGHRPGRRHLGARLRGQRRRGARRGDGQRRRRRGQRDRGARPADRQGPRRGRQHRRQVGDVVDDVTDTLDQLDTGDLLKGDLLNVDVNVDLDADLAAPINGAVAANANVAAPIDAAVAANILSDDSEATALSQQDAIINQNISGQPIGTSDQTSDIDQGSIEPPDTDTASADGTDATTGSDAVRPGAEHGRGGPGRDD